jgi:hypothetical protein
LRRERKLECNCIPRIWGRFAWNAGELRRRRCNLTWYLLRDKCEGICDICSEESGKDYVEFTFKKRCTFS